MQGCINLLHIGPSKNNFNAGLSRKTVLPKCYWPFLFYANNGRAAKSLVGGGGGGEAGEGGGGSGRLIFV